MPRIALFNCLIGFCTIFIAAAGGSFLALDITQQFLNLNAANDTWELLLAKSAHGHFNLFGYLHILVGLTMPYSLLSTKLKYWQTYALTGGTLAMGPGLIWRSFESPTSTTNIAAIVLGILLSLALLSIGLHIYGITLKLLRHS